MDKSQNVEWKHINGLPLGYEVSNMGEVRLNCGDHVEPIKIHYSSTGTPMVYIRNHQLSLHRLVAETFIPKGNGKFVAKHKDGDAANNRVDNLEWVSYSDVSKSVFRTGKLKGTRVLCHETGKAYATIQAASFMTGVPICAIEYGIQNQCKMYGYTFSDIYDDTKYEKDMIYITRQQIIELGTKLDSTTLLSEDEYMKLLEG